MMQPGPIPYLVIALALCIPVTVFAGATEDAADDDHKGYLSWGLDGGPAWATGDGAELWESGTTVGISVLYPLTRVFSVGARGAFTRWTLSTEDAVAALIPEGATPTFVESDGDFQVLELTIVGRATRDALIGRRIGAFAQLAGGVYHVSVSAQTVVEYELSSTSDIVVAQADGSDYRGGLNIGAGISFSLTDESRFELCPTYHAVFEPSGPTNLVTLVFAFRVEFSPRADD